MYTPHTWVALLRDSARLRARYSRNNSSGRVAVEARLDTARCSLDLISGPRRAKGKRSRVFSWEFLPSEECLAWLSLVSDMRLEARRGPGPVPWACLCPYLYVTSTVVLAPPILWPGAGFHEELFVQIPFAQPPQRAEGLKRS